MPLFIFRLICTLAKQSIIIISLSHDPPHAWQSKAVLSCRFKTDFPPLSNSREQEEENESTAWQARERGCEEGKGVWEGGVFKTRCCCYCTITVPAASCGVARLWKGTHGHGEPRKWPSDRIRRRVHFNKRAERQQSPRGVRSHTWKKKTRSLSAGHCLRKWWQCPPSRLSRLKRTLRVLRPFRLDSAAFDWTRLKAWRGLLVVPRRGSRCSARTQLRFAGPHWACWPVTSKSNLVDQAGHHLWRMTSTIERKTLEASE